MKKVEVTLPDLALLVGTRAMFGAGLALLLADKLPKDQRKAIGWTLSIIGAVTTIPLAINFFAKRERASLSRWKLIPVNTVPEGSILFLTNAGRPATRV